MSNPKYVVSAPMVYLQYADPTVGAVIQRAFYAGASVPESITEKSLQHHLDGQMIVEADSVEAELLGVPAGTPVPGETPNEPLAEPAVRVERAKQAVKAQSKQGGGQPSVGSRKEDWVDYAVSQGADRGQAEAATKEELIEKYGA